MGHSDLAKPYVEMPESMVSICAGFGPPFWNGEEIEASPTRSKMDSLENWPAFALADCTADVAKRAAAPRVKSWRREEGSSASIWTPDAAALIGRAGASPACGEKDSESSGAT